MRRPRSPFALVVFLLWAIPAAAQIKPAGDVIPLDRCDRLRTIPVQAGGREWRFLLDTAATSMLNIRSFSEGNSKAIQITSWSGTAATSAREVTLPAIDLTPISKTCGGPIDGILGVDLIEILGLKIDVKKGVASLDGKEKEVTFTAEQKSLETMRREVEQHENECLLAFNRADAKGFGACLDPEIVLFTPWGEYRGREQALEYVRKTYFQKDSPAQFEMSPTYFRFAGDTAFHGYNYVVRMPDRKVEGRGTSVCHKVDGRWVILTMHNSISVADPMKEK
jgi:hypothetical protein